MKVSQPNGSKFVYTGQISNGQANGQGTLSFTEGPYKGDSYFGPFKNNNFHTEGTLLLTSKKLVHIHKRILFQAIKLEGTLHLPEKFMRDPMTILSVKISKKF